MLRTYLIRSDARPIVGFFSSSPTAETNTKEASPTEQLVPTPAVVFGVKSTGAAAPVKSASPYVTSSASAPEMADSEAESAAVSEAQQMTDALDRDVEEGADENALSPSPEPEGEEARGTEAEEQRPSSDVEANSIPAPAAPVRAQPVEQPPADAGAPKIHLSIDSLPHLQVVQAIPVTVTPIGDKLYAATIDAIRLTGTSSTMSEALVTVKEEVESLFGRLTKSRRLDTDEARDLQYLQGHIASSEAPREQRHGLWR